MPFFGGGGGDYHIIVTNIKGGNDANPSGTGSNNMALGNGALQSLTIGDGNVAIGNNAGNAFTTENANTVLGYNAATLVTSFVGRATIIGAESLLGVAGYVDKSIVMGRVLNGSGVTGLNLSQSVLIS